MFEVCFVIVLAVHLICVNVSTAGPLVCIWLEWREGRGDPLAGRAGRYLAGVSLALLLLGIVFGLLLAWMLWSETFREVLSHLDHRVKWGVAELAVSLFLMAVHLVWWARSTQPSWLVRAVRMLVLSAAGTNLMYHFPFLFAIISNMLVEVRPVDGRIESADFVGLMMKSNVLARTMHFVMASLAMTGIALIVYSLRQSRNQGGETADGRVAVWGARIALAPTLLQIPVGMWFFLALPESSKQLLMGGSLAGTTLLCVSILAAVLLLHQLAGIALGDVSRSLQRNSVVTIVVIVLLMCGTLRCSIPTSSVGALSRQQTTEAERGN